MLQQFPGAHSAQAPQPHPTLPLRPEFLNLLESYYVSLKTYGIGVTAVCPANIRSRIYEAAIQGRPEQYKNTGYNVSEDTQKLLASIHANGMDPRVLADWMKKGIENEQFLVVPYPSGPRMVELALRRFVDYASPEGMQRLAEKAKQPPTEEELRLNSEREGYDVGKRPTIASGSFKDVGFGKAKKDLDWVDPAKK